MAGEDLIKCRINMKGSKSIGCTIKGNIVNAIKPDSPADRAGVLVGWEFYEIGGKRVNTDGPASVVLKGVSDAISDQTNKWSIFDIVFRVPPTNAAGLPVKVAEEPVADSGASNPSMPRAFSEMTARSEVRDGGSSGRHEYVQLSFEISSLALSSTQIPKGSSKHQNVYWVAWDRAHNGAGQTDMTRPDKDKTTGEWRCLFDYKHTIAGAVHVPRALHGEPKSRRTGKMKNMKVSIWRQKTSQHRGQLVPGTDEVICELVLPLQYVPSSDGKRQQVSLTVRQGAGGAQAGIIGILTVSCKMTALPRDSPEVLAAKKHRAEILASKGVASNQQASPYRSMSPAAVTTEFAKTTGSAAQAAPPPQLVDAASTHHLGWLANPDPETEAIVLAIYRETSELHRLAARLRQQQRETMELDQQRLNLHQDLQDLQLDIGEQVALREQMQTQLLDERERTHSLGVHQKREIRAQQQKDAQGQQNCSMQ